MGLLDDAIREHLELKRRRGADPGMVAREERDALAPVFPDESDDQGGDLEADEAAVAGVEHVVGDVDFEEHAVQEHAAGDPAPADLSTVGQETAELDMQAVMDEHAHAADGEGADPIDERPAAGGQAGGGPDEPSFEWEVSSDATAEQAPGGISGQERLSFE